MDFSPSASPVSLLVQALRRALPDIVAPREWPADYAQAWEWLSRLAGVEEAALARYLAEPLGMPWADRLDTVDDRALGAVPFDFCQKQNVLPVRFESEQLVIATANPFDRNVADRVAFLSRAPLRWLLASPATISDGLLAASQRAATREAGNNELLGGRAAGDLSENAIVRLGQALLDMAVGQRASDLHLQPYLGSVLVRARVDGQMRRLTILPELVGTTLIRHFKALSGMESTNVLVPQDGRLSRLLNGRDFDIRVSSLPASRGERLVMRFLDQGRVHRLSGAGFSLAALQTMRRLLARPSGMVVMTGPTGSGKTSTLYAMLAELNRASVNILTVENPVEYRLNGISQIEVNEKAGRGFAAVLRSMLRQDPDVILVGEIRDAETAAVAVQAALTGHLVLTTLHTNDAVTAIPRLVGLGVEPAMLADALVGVVSQRLCRQLCAACRAPVTEPLTREESAFLSASRHQPGARAVGCVDCDHTGYHGRLPIVDILEIDVPLRQAIAAGDTSIAHLEALRGSGLGSLGVSGALRVISGDTTVREVLAEAGPAFWLDTARRYGTDLSAVGEWYPTFEGSVSEVILVSTDAVVIDDVKRALPADEFTVSVVASTALASERMKAADNVSFVIMDIPASATLDSALQLLAGAARDMYWSRLPAAVLLGAGIAGDTAPLRERGVMSPCLAKPLDPAALLTAVRSGQAR